MNNILLGPLTWKDGDDSHYLLGVTSFVPARKTAAVFGIKDSTCGNPAYPDVFTRITSFLDWLEKNGVTDSGFINKCSGTPDFYSFLFLCRRLIIVTLLQWYNFRTARSWTLWCIRLGGCLCYCWLNCSSMRVAWAGPQVGPWLLQMISFCLLVMGERSTPLRWWSVHIRCGCPVFSVVSIFLMPAVRQSFVSPQRNDRSVAIARPLILGGRQHHRSSAAPDAQSLQDPAKDPRLKVSGRR